MPSMDISIVPPPVVSQPVLLGILWSGSIFSLLVLSTRLEIRRRIYSTLKTDDYLVICAWVLSLATTILWTILRDDLYASLAAADSVASLNEVLDEAGTMLRGMLASDILSWTCLWSVKLSFMAFFYPLGKQIKSQRMLWWGVIGFILIGYLVCVGTLDYECLTSRGLDILNICSKRRVIDWEYAALRTITAMDVVTDALIVMVPGSIVWRVHIAWRKKLALTGICCLTIVMIVAAILRIAICSTGKKPDVSWWLVWNSVETTLAITTACIASFRSIYCHAKEPCHAPSPTAAVMDRHRSPVNVHRAVDTLTITSAEYSLCTIDTHTGSQDHLRCDEDAYDLKNLSNV